jgi:hypothetical protein
MTLRFAGDWSARQAEQSLAKSKAGKWAPHRTQASAVGCGIGSSFRARAALGHTNHISSRKRNVLGFLAALPAVKGRRLEAMAATLFSMAPKLGLPKNKNLTSGCFSRGHRRLAGWNYRLDVKLPERGHLSSSAQRNVKEPQIVQADHWCNWRAIWGDVGQGQTIDSVQFRVGCTPLSCRCCCAAEVSGYVPKAAVAACAF